MLARHWIKFLDLNLFRCGALVFSSGIEMTRTSTGFQFDFFTHDSYPLDFFAASAHFKQHCFDTVLVDGTQTCVRQTDGNKTAFTLYPQATTLQIRQETTFCFVIRVGHIVTNNSAFSRYLTDTCHSNYSNQFSKEARFYPKTRAVFNLRVDSFG